MSLTSNTEYHLPLYLIDSPFETLSKQSTSPTLPSAWNRNESIELIQVGKNGLRAKYIGGGSDDAAIRTDYPIPRECGLYYYEVEIINKSLNGYDQILREYIGIGFATNSDSLDYPPGWYPNTNSYGYHGDDGRKFHASRNEGEAYGPPFTTGDVIGCGINFLNGTAFYTKNGHNLGIAFRDIEGDFYPIIGLSAFNETVEANFGQDEFVFDVVKYAKELFAETNENEAIAATNVISSD
ncbi:4221_t:CDS:2, partial [Paraglomus occultum]